MDQQTLMAMILGQQPRNFSGVPGQTPPINPMSGSTMRDPVAMAGAQPMQGAQPQAGQQPLIGQQAAAGLAGNYGDQMNQTRAMQQMQTANTLRNAPGPEMLRAGRVDIAASPLSHLATAGKRIKGNMDYKKAQAAEEAARKKIGNNMQDLAMYMTPQSDRDDQRRMSLAPGQRQSGVEAVMAALRGG